MFGQCPDAGNNFPSKLRSEQITTGRSTAESRFKAPVKSAFSAKCRGFLVLRWRIVCEARLAVNIDKLTERAIITLIEYYCCQTDLALP